MKPGAPAIETELKSEVGQTSAVWPKLATRMQRGLAGRNWAWLEWVWMAAIVGLFGLHAVHLRADFPNYSPWMDYAKYTDEGWYGNAAIAAFVRGSWYVPGDFNTAVALPVWPFLEWLLFHLTGVNVVAARALVVAVFGGNLVLSYALVRVAGGHDSRVGFSGLAYADHPGAVGKGPRWVALLAASLIAGNSFLYCFSRLAILEPLVIFLLLLGWLLALRLPHLESPQAGVKRAISLVAIGVVLCLMVLTKTTAIALAPSVFYLVWQGYRRDMQGLRGPGIKALAIVAVAAAVPWAAYYSLLVRPRYVADFKYLFSANIYQQPTTAYGWVMAGWYALHGGLWIDGVLFPLGVVLLLLSALVICEVSGARSRMRLLWQNPLPVAALLAVLFQVAFIGYHNNMQPRYYMVIAYPLFLLIALGTEVLLRYQRLLGGLAVALIAASFVFNARQMVGYARHPEYTFVNAAENLTRYIDEHPNGNRLLLSISGSEIGLVTRLPSICDDFGTLELPLRIHQYQPGWYAAWNELDEGTLVDLHTQFRLEEVAHFRAFDDEDRNVLILYKLHPLPLSQQRLEDDGGDDNPASAEDSDGGSGSSK